MEMGEEEKKVRKAILLRILEKQNLNRSSSSVHHQKPKMKTLTRMQTKKVETTKKNNDDHKLLQCAVGGLNLSRHKSTLLTLAEIANLPQTLQLQ